MRLSSYCGGSVFINQSSVFNVTRFGGTDVRYKWSVVNVSSITSFHMISFSNVSMTVIFNSPGLYQVNYNAYNDVSNVNDTR